MSASIYWKPITPDKNEIPTHAPSRQLGVLARLFGGEAQSWKLTQKDRGTLGIAMRVAAELDMPTQDFLLMLLGALEKHTEIEVWAEY